MYDPSPGDEAPLRQCEVLSSLQRAVLAVDSIGDDVPVVDLEDHAFAILMTQDCDLEQDYHARHGTDGNPDKLVPDILLCPVIPAVNLRGEQAINSSIWRQIQRFGHERYHLLMETPPEADRLREGMPTLGIDFKRLFSVRTDEVYRRIELGQTQRRCHIRSPYLEHLARRFANYHSRVALPAP